MKKRVIERQEKQALKLDSPRRRQVLAGAGIISMGLFNILSANAESSVWVPKKTVKIVVPYPPAGGIDIVARFISPELEKQLGQSVLVDNRAGAAGMIGSEYVYHSPPDGYTYIVASADTHSINPHVYKDIRYKAREFTPVAPIAGIEYVLTARPGLPVNNLRELVKLARSKELTFGSSGVGSSAHAITEVFKLKYHLKLLHVPYRGSGPAANAVMGGQIDLVMLPTAIAIASRSKLKLLGLVSKHRFKGAPDLPTIGEQGYPIDLDAAWVGLLAPPKTPRAPVERLHAIIDQFVHRPETQERLQALGMIPMTLSLDEFAKYLDEQYELWGAAVRAAKISVDIRQAN